MREEVSVLIRTRDIEKYFEKMLRRLSSQSMKPNELIIVDNYSSPAKLEDLIDLFFQCAGGERFDHIAVDPRLCGLDDLLALGLRSHHQHRQLGQAGVRPDGLEQIYPRHPGHIPVGDQEIELSGLQFG